MKGMDQFKYLRLVQGAKLGSYEKLLLYFYATTYNWKNESPSRYSLRTSCALLGMSMNTYNEARKRLEALGWVLVIARGRQDPSWVYPQIGRDDPGYESKSCAKWHPANREQILSLSEVLETRADEDDVSATGA